MGDKVELDLRICPCSIPIGNLRYPRTCPFEESAQKDCAAHIVLAPVVGEDGVAQGAVPQARLEACTLEELDEDLRRLLGLHPRRHVLRIGVVAEPAPLHAVGHDIVPEFLIVRTGRDLIDVDSQAAFELVTDVGHRVNRGS